MATVEGYPGRSTVPAGNAIGFHLAASNGLAGPRTLGVDRVRPVAGSATTASFGVNVPVQAVPTTNAWEGYGWTETHSFAVPASWTSGLYRLHEGGDTLLDFVVRSALPGTTSPILLQIGTHTAQAYWAQGGRSFYTNPRAHSVSYDRPGAQYRQGVPLMAWLENEGFAVEFCASHDLHSTPQLLDSYALLLIVEHDEYWSKEMRDGVERFVRHGGNVAVFSGNTCFRQVRLEGQRDHVMPCYKFPGSEVAVDRDLYSIAMASPPVCRPTPTTLGAGFTHGAGCWGNTGLMSAAAFTVAFPGHWAFAGVTNPTIAAGLVGYETDAVAYVEEAEGYPRVTGEDGVAPTTTVLATADLRHWGPGGKPGMATISLLVRNGCVFNAASVSWQAGLAADADVRRVTRNVIERLRSRQRWTVWEHIGHANRVSAMASLENKLWCSTTDDWLWRRFPVGADAPWTPVGHANDVCSMASAAGRLWALTGDGSLWRRVAIERDVNWDLVGRGPPAGTRAIAGTTFLLYAVDSNGKLWMAPARTPVVWEAVPSMASTTEPAICALVAYEDVLFAATVDGRLVRTGNDFVYESDGWVEVHHCNFATALAVVDTMLFVTTTENRLWWLDLRSLTAP